MPNNILLDYFFPISTTEPTPPASTAFLKQVLVVVKPKVGAVEDTITLCTQASDIDAFSETAVEADQLFDAGMSRVYVIAVDDLENLGADIEGHESDFYTILISADFSDAEIDAADFGDFEGVVGMASDDNTKNTARAIEQCAFRSTDANRGKNMFYAFGKLLSNLSSWKNQQYITCPVADDVDTLGEAEALFDDKISFVMEDAEFGKKLGLFACRGKAIARPYILKNLEIEMQSAALTYVSANQPAYTKVQAALIEDELQKVINGYIASGEIESGTVTVSLEQENFVASSSIEVAEPKALWRIFGELAET